MQNDSNNMYERGGSTMSLLYFVIALLGLGSFIWGWSKMPEILKDWTDKKK